jgi:hypothetical protein
MVLSCRNSVAGSETDDNTGNLTQDASASDGDSNNGIQNEQEINIDIDGIDNIGSLIDLKDSEGLEEENASLFTHLVCNMPPGCILASLPSSTAPSQFPSPTVHVNVAATSGAMTYSPHQPLLPTPLPMEGLEGCLNSTMPTPRQTLEQGPIVTPLLP